MFASGSTRRGATVEAPGCTLATMAWEVTAPVPGATAQTKSGYLPMLAIRVDSDTGETEFLLAHPQSAPQWIAQREILSVGVRASG